MIRKLFSTLFLLIALFYDAAAQVPVANISATPLSGCAPLAVSFNDNSTNSPTSRAWTFQGGSPPTSGSSNIPVIFTTPGTHVVTLVSSNASGSSQQATITITVLPSPVADFNQDKTSGCAPTTVQFTNASNGGGSGANITTYLWDFGDGFQSSVPDPSHRYTSSGSYPVTLEVQNNFGCQGSAEVKNVQKAIVLSGDVVPNFSSSLNSTCNLPVTATFTSSSTGPGNLSYLWNFGDGSPTNPGTTATHPYIAAGNYNVTLAVTSDQGCSDTLAVKVTISSNGNLTDFSYPDTVCINSLVNFKNTSSPFPNSSSWDYGDGVTSSSINGQHTYTSAGTYPVTLTNVFSGCGGSQTKSITVVTAPTTSFTTTNANGCQPSLTVSFNNTSVGATSWNWNFNDGTSSSLKTPPPHMYTAYGDYNITLTSSSAGGTCFSQSTATVKIEKPLATINNKPIYGCAPFIYNPSGTATAIDGVASYSWVFGNGSSSPLQTPPSQTFLPGVYKEYFTITTTGGCQSTDSATIDVGTNKPSPAFTFTPASACVKSAIQFTTTPPTTANQWIWDFGDGNTSNLQNPPHTYLQSGNFTVKLTALDNGCFDTLSQTVIINPPSANFTDSSLCSAKNTFYFRDESIGATGWAWTFGDGGTASTKNPIHTYTSTVPTTEIVTLMVTAGACVDNISIPIQINQTPTVTASSNPVCVNAPVSFTAGGNIPKAFNYEFIYGDGINYTTVSSISPPHMYSRVGTYASSVIVTDSNNCAYTSNVDSVVVDGPTPSFTGAPAISCGPIIVNFVNTSTPYPTSSPIVSSSWDFGDGTTSPQYSPSHPYTVQGNFAPQLTVMDKNGCTATLDTAKPIAVSIMNAAFSVSDSSCPNKPIYFTSTSTGGFSPTLNWRFGDGDSTSAVSPVHQYTTVGTYNASLVLTDTYGCVQTSSLVPILIDTPHASFTLSATSTNCPPLNEQFKFTGHYAASYTWFFGNGASSTAPSPSTIYITPADYYPILRVTSPGGCVATSDSVRIHVAGPFGAFTYSPYAGCDSLTVNFQVSSPNAVAYSWYYGDGRHDSTNAPVNTEKHTYTAPNQYTPIVNLYDSAGCKVPYIGNNVIEIDHLTKTSFISDKSQLCDSGIVNFTNKSVISSGTTISNYNWNFGDGTDSSGVDSTIAYKYTAIGNDSATLTITTTGGCTGSAKIPVNIVASPKISIGGLVSQCAPGILNYSGIESPMDPHDPLTWAWNFGNGQTSTLQSPMETYPKAGEYVVSLTATNTKGCSTMTDTTKPNHLFIYPVPTVFAGLDTTACVDVATGNATVLLQAGGEETSYNWFFTPPTSLNCTTCSNPVVTTPSTTSLVLQGSSLNGCTAKDTIVITVNTPVTVNAGAPDSVCLGQSVSLNATGASLYVWTPSEGLSNADISNPRATPDATQIGNQPSNIITYTVTGYDSKKCFSSMDSVQITAFNYPTISMAASTTINVGGSYQINPTVSSDAVSLNWTPSNSLSCSTCLSPVAAPMKTTNYTLTATNTGGCSKMDTILVQVICNNTNFFVPNSFSPNGDGVNDHFIVNGIGINVIPSISIYNRWGQLVFQKSNFPPNSASEAWDGTFNGKPAPPDVYIYTIQILCNNNTLIPYHGNVTLIR